MTSTALQMHKMMFFMKIFEVDSGDCGFGVEAEPCVGPIGYCSLVDIINKENLI